MKKSLLPSLESTLSRHLEKFPQPQHACACMTIEGGKVSLTARFVANSGSWSHVAKAPTLVDACRVIRSKLGNDLKSLGPDEALQKCGLGANHSASNHSCANSGRCPNLHELSSFVEIARVEAVEPDA